jgi:hypothetical protein
MEKEEKEKEKGKGNENEGDKLTKEKRLIREISLLYDLVNEQQRYINLLLKNADDYKWSHQDINIESELNIKIFNLRSQLFDTENK